MPVTHPDRRVVLESCSIAVKELRYYVKVLLVPRTFLCLLGMGLILEQGLSSSRRDLGVPGISPRILCFSGRDLENSGRELPATQICQSLRVASTWSERAVSVMGLREGSAV